MRWRVFAAPSEKQILRLHPNEQRTLAGGPASAQDDNFNFGMFMKHGLKGADAFFYDEFIHADLQCGADLAETVAPLARPVGAVAAAE